MGASNGSDLAETVSAWPAEDGSVVEVSAVVGATADASQRDLALAVARSAVDPRVGNTRVSDDHASQAASVVKRGPNPWLADYLGALPSSLSVTALSQLHEDRLVLSIRRDPTMSTVLCVTADEEAARRCAQVESPDAGAWPDRPIVTRHGELEVRCASVRSCTAAGRMAGGPVVVAFATDRGFLSGADIDAILDPIEPA